MAGRTTALHTFLFSDIEGSTRRWQEHGPAMQDALDVHDAMVAAAVEDAGGRVFKHTGDGVCAAFPSAGAAVAAAVDIQRRLVGEPFEAVGGLAVRIGIHSGEAEERAGDFFGPALNRTARLMGLAHGGQVLVSGTAAELLDEAAASGRIELVELGPHQLRDITRPEQVHQVLAPGLQRDFPPLRTAATAPNRLPETRTPFVGRESELSELSRLLEERRLVTLVGVGGTGKTRLALEVARRAAPSFPGGAFFADLSALTDGELVFPALASALGMPSADAGGLSMADAVLDFLADRRALLVLDNCEQIVDDCAKVADALLDACPRLVVVATSREALDVEGEHSWPVSSLSTPRDEQEAAASEAVQLFVERARAAAGAFELKAEDVRPVVEICRRLDGIPLAIELAASRVADMQPAEIAARLDDRFHLLVGGRRRRVQRQQTLEAALDWSYHLLTQAEQSLLRRLSVFAGGFTAPAAAGVCIDHGDGVVGELLRSLVAKSLVVREQGDGSTTRYRLLETMRLYAAQKLLDAGEAATYRERHRDHFLAVLEAPPFDDTLGVYPLVESFVVELENLRAAVEWSSDQGRDDLCRRLALRMTGAWALGGYLEEGTARLGSLAQSGSPAEQAECLAMVAFLAMYSGSFDLMIESARRSLALDPHGRCASVALLLSLLYGVFDRYDRDALHAAFDDARRRAHHHGMTEFARLATTMENHFYVVEGDFDRAESMDTDVPVADTYAGFVFTIGVVISAVAAGRPQAAYERLSAQPTRAWSRSYDLLLRGMVSVELGRVAEGRDALVDAARGQLEVPTPLGLGDCLISFAGLALAEGDPARATTLLEVVWASRGMASYRSPASWVLSRRYRYLAKERLEPDAWEQARALANRLDTVTALRAEVERYA